MRWIGSVFEFLFGTFLRGFFSLIVGVFATGALLLFGPPLPIEATYHPIDERLARERLQAEVAAARAIGFEADRTVRLEERVSEVEITLAAGECVALVAAAWGSWRIDAVTAAPGGPATRYDRATLASRDAEGLVAHAQACSDRDVTWAAEVRARAIPRLHGDASGELQILRAPRERVAGALNRGWVLR